MHVVQPGAASCMSRWAWGMAFRVHPGQQASNYEAAELLVSVSMAFQLCSSRTICVSQCLRSSRRARLFTFATLALDSLCQCLG